MSEAALTVASIPLAVVFYGSGLLLWPMRRWLRRKQAVHGRAMFYVFVAQIVGYAATLATSGFVRLQHYYYWFFFLMELNVLFTIAGVIAGLRDARYEKSCALKNRSDPGS